MKNKFITGLLALLLFGTAFGIYRVVYPNDFFLSMKTFKNNDKYLFKKTFSHLKIQSKEHVNPDLHALLSNPDHYLKDPKTWLKNNKKRTVATPTIGKSKFFIKRYNIKDGFDYFRKCPFRSSKAFRSLYYAQKFKEKGLLTPQPIALYEKRIGFLWTSTYLVFEYIEGKTLEDHFQNSNISHEEKEKIVHKLGSHLETFYQNKWVHRDLTLRNLFIRENQIFILDLDDLHSYAFCNVFFKKKYKKKHTEHLSTELFQNQLKLPKFFWLHI